VLPIWQSICKSKCSDGMVWVPAGVEQLGLMRDGVERFPRELMLWNAIPGVREQCLVGFWLG
jgi:hypothetical protein